MVGRFHLGQNYDMHLWMSNSDCGVFPCHEEVVEPVKRSDAQGNVTWQKRKHMADISIVVTESVILKLKTDNNIKNVGRLHAWACLPALEQIKHSLEYNEQITMQFRTAREGQKPWKLAVSMNQNSQDCIALVLRRLKQSGIKA